MQARSELHLVIPGICGPLAETQSLKSSPVIERWIRTLSKSTCQLSASGTDAFISEIFDLQIGDDFPSAALTLLANGKYDADMYYMHADPVHLQADMDHAVLTSSTDLDIKEDESSALCETLNQHFEQDGLDFFTLNKDQWFVSSRKEISMHTTSLVDATGRNINFILPEGESAVRWKQVLTEVQMLMHSHEINAARESAGLFSINSLWFHGSGKLVDLVSDKVDLICSHDDMLKGLAAHIRCGYKKVPDTADEYADYLLSCEQGTVNLLHLSELEHLVNYTDVSLWLAKLANLLDGWIYPVLSAANKNNIKVTLYPCDGKRYQFSRYDSLRFWRRIRRRNELEKYVNSY